MNNYINIVNSQQMLELLFDTADIGMCVTAEDRTFVKVNKAYCSIYGYTESELIGKPYTMVLPKEHRGTGDALHDEYLNGESDTIPSEWIVRRKDGTLLTVWVTAGKMESEGGIKLKITTVTDISERKQRENEMSAALSEIKFLFSELHHRTKNNLNIINGLTYMLRSTAKSESVKEDYDSLINKINIIGKIHDAYFIGDSSAPITVETALTLVQSTQFVFKGMKFETNATIAPPLPFISYDTAVDIGIAYCEVLHVVKRFLSANSQPDEIQLKTSLGQIDNFFEITILQTSQVEASNNSLLKLINDNSITQNILREGKIEIISEQPLHISLRVEKR